MPIFNAKDLPLSANSGTLPNMSDALLDWFLPLVFTKIVKTVVNFKVVETPTAVSFSGVWQPFSAQQLKLMPDGQRDWKWFTVHALPALILVPDELITFRGLQYRVKMKTDYKEYGYVKYDLVEDFTGSGP